MLGIVIGAIASVGLLTFLNKDPKAIQQRREEKLKQEAEQK